MRLKLEAEQVGEHGGITGRGALKILGAPPLNLLDIVVREAVQNSWDARDTSSGSGKIVFGVESLEFTKKQRTQLTAMLSDGLNTDSPLFQLPAVDEPLEALAIYDRGTRGLGGGVDPAIVTSGPRDFIRFVYMVGETKPNEDSFSAGGTYGFGRSSFLRASTAGTILIHSRWQPTSKKPESRFIGMTWTEPYDEGGLHFTGRHWWGEKRGRPVSGPEADAIARSLGMPLPEDGELGTTILVLQPKWPTRDDGDSLFSNVTAPRDEAAVRIEEGILANCWPRLLDESIELRFRWFGEERAVPNPRTHPRLRHFARAFDIVTTKRTPGAGSERTPIRCLRPEKTLGTLGLVSAAFIPGARESEDEVMGGSHPLHHVALMRNTRLVIEYLACPLPQSGMQYAGVFLADASVDEVFARSEPPSHDRWVKERLEDRAEKSFVNVTLKRIPEAAARFAVPLPGPDGGGAEGGELANVAEELGALLPVNEGGAAGPQSPSGRGSGGNGSGGGGSGNGGGGGKGGPPLSRPTLRHFHPRRSSEGDSVILEVPFELQPWAGGTSVVLSAEAGVMVEGGRPESEAPQGASTPEVVGWVIQGTKRPVPVAGPSIEVAGATTVRGHVLIRQPSDCSVRVRLTALAGTKSGQGGRS